MMETDLVIIGGGPAGLSAAFEPASNGLKVTIVDESFSLGGQLKQQTQLLDNLPSTFKKQRGTELSKTLIKRLLLFNVDFLSQHTMVGMYKDGRIGVSNGQKVIPIRAKKMIITTGAAEEATVFPGWTLPGVMTIGAAQLLINRERVLPGKHAVIIGTTDFSLEVAKQLHFNGVTIHGIIEKGTQIRGNNPENRKYIKESNIPVFLNTSITRVIGSGEVETIFIDNKGTEEVLDIDLICIGEGVTPILEPFEMMSCQLTYQTALGGWVPRYGDNFETSTPSTYVAGNAAGITCMGAILVIGELAGINALESLGALNPEHITARKETLWNTLGLLESRESNETFHARISLIKDFHSDVGKQLPTFLDSILEGC